MITLKDNTPRSFTADLEKYLSLQSLSNKKISELLDEHGQSLLVYPHSFYQCDDEIDGQTLLSLQCRSVGNRLSEVTLKAGNIVGFISVNDIDVTIHSRFSMDSAKEDFFLHYMLHKVLCLNLVNLPHSSTDEGAFNFLLYLFPKFLNEALTQGIYKEYHKKCYNDTNVRGRIDINRHLKMNLPFNGNIAYRTREFSYDNHVTELIRHTIDYISKTKTGKSLLKNDATTRTNVSQIISATPHYNRRERDQIIKRNTKAICHPYYSHYTSLQKLCLRILRCESIKYGDKDKIYGILFDVAYLWEEYLATLLSKQGFKHPQNKKGLGGIYLSSPKNFIRYPDFYRECDGTIIDAKYKKEIDHRNDINQMITYMYRLRGEHGVFVQPTVDVSKENRYRLNGYGEDHNAELRKYLFQIPKETNNDEDFALKILQSEKQLCNQFKLS